MGRGEFVVGDGGDAVSSGTFREFFCAYSGAISFRIGTGLIGTMSTLNCAVSSGTFREFFCSSWGLFPLG